jgi:hypothetical protein
MGQYFRLINRVQKQLINPHTIKEGAKMGEGTDIIGQIAMFLLASTDDWSFISNALEENESAPLCGAWAGDAIEYMGDYHLEWPAIKEEYEDISVHAYRQAKKVLRWDITDSYVVEIIEDNDRLRDENLDLKEKLRAK